LENSNIENNDLRKEIENQLEGFDLMTVDVKNYIKIKYLKKNILKILKPK